MRGFLRGIGLGSVVAAGGLVVASQLIAPPQVEQALSPDIAVSDAKPAATLDEMAEGDVSAKGDLSPTPVETAPVDAGAVETTPVEAAPVEAAPAEAASADVAVGEPSAPAAVPPSPLGASAEPDPAPVGSASTETTQVAPDAVPLAPEPPSALGARAPDAATAGQQMAPAAADQVVDAAPPAIISDAPVAPDQDTPLALPVVPEAQPEAMAGAGSVAAPGALGQLADADSPAEIAQAPAEPPAAPPTDAPAEANLQPEPQGVHMPGTMAANAPSTGNPGAPLGLPADAAPDSAEPPPPAPLEEALLTPAPAPAAEAPAMIAPDPLPETLPAVITPEAETLQPTPGLTDQASDVVTDRLPRIGAGADVPADGAATAEEPAEATADETAAPLQKYARSFENPEGKPLFAIILVDDGAEGVNRQDLAALDLPLTIVIDPVANDAEQRAAIWRKGGQEVVMAATGLPAGATPADVEQTFQALGSRLPEAVGVLDLTGKTFQDDRALSRQVIAILKAQGRGVISFDQGLNAADQVARREGLPSVTLFRRLDAAGESVHVIRRYLDRAAFKAAQEGHVAVIGSLHPDTVEAILEWAVEGRAASMALAPVSALMK